MKWLTVVPAYGRDYKSEEEVFKDFLAGKDFLVMDISCPYDGKYCSIHDLGDYTHIKARYQRKEQFAIIRNVNGSWTLEPED